MSANAQGRYWRVVHSLPVQVARAQIEALRTVGDPEGRFRVKWQMVRSLYRQGYNADEVRELFRLIDWMLRLPEALAHRFEQELATFEEQMDMPYVTSVERIAEARGEARGQVRGAATVLRRLLARACGPLPQDIEQRLLALPSERLEAMADAALDFRSVQDVRTWLEAHGQSAH